jgi:hypothetical protein
LSTSFPYILKKQIKSITITETSAIAPTRPISNTEFPECKTILVPTDEIDYAINMLASGITIKENMETNPDSVKTRGNNPDRCL